MMKTFHKSQVFRPQKRVNQIKGECDGHDACQYEIEIHGFAPSNTVAKDRVTDRQGEKAQSQSDQRCINHRLLPADGGCAAKTYLRRAS
jgi:hypothetical protein